MAFSTLWTNFSRSALVGRERIWDRMSLSPQASPQLVCFSELSEPEGEEGGSRDSSGMCGELMGEAALTACPPGTTLAVLAVPLWVPEKKRSRDSDRPRGVCCGCGDVLPFGGIFWSVYSPVNAAVQAIWRGLTELRKGTSSPVHAVATPPVFSLLIFKFEISPYLSNSDIIIGSNCPGFKTYNTSTANVETMFLSGQLHPLNFLICPNSRQERFQREDEQQRRRWASLSCTVVQCKGAPRGSY